MSNRLGPNDTFYKDDPSDVIWQVETPGRVGEFLFSFDKKKVFNMFADYPWKLTAEQKKIFDKQFPFWADFFKDRQGTVESSDWDKTKKTLDESSK